MSGSKHFLSLGIENGVMDGFIPPWWKLGEILGCMARSVGKILSEAGCLSADLGDRQRQIGETTEPITVVDVSLDGNERREGVRP